MKTKITLLFLFISCSIAATAQTLEISGELRPRFEANYGFGAAPTEDDVATFYVTQRSRINAGLYFENYSFYVSFQDIRVWGSDNVASNTGPNFSTGTSGVHQAWGEFKFNSKSNVRVGRQVFSYDQQRLLSARNWNQAALSYDAVRFHTQIKDIQLDLAVSYNNDSDKGSNAGFGVDDFNMTRIEYRLRTLNFLHLKKDFSKTFSLSFLAMLTGYQKSDTCNVIYLMGTYGFYGAFRNEGLEAKLNAYYQNGKSQKGLDMSAFMATAELKYHVNKGGAGIGGDYFSGNDVKKHSNSNKEHNFDLLYGTRRGFLGYLNQYTLIKKDTKGGGLIDIYPNVYLKVCDKGKLDIAYHLFYLANPVADPLSEGRYLDGSLGSEIDVAYTHTFSKSIELSGGFCYYVRNETFDKIKYANPDNAEDPYFGWVMLTFKPSWKISR